jgi:hypothetical protein
MIKVAPLAFAVNAQGILKIQTIASLTGVGPPP